MENREGGGREEFEEGRVEERRMGGLMGGRGESRRIGREKKGGWVALMNVRLLEDFI